MNNQRRLALAAATGMALTPLGLLPMQTAHAAGSGSIDVSIRNWSWQSLPGVKVTLYNTATGAAVATRTTPVDNPGTPDDENTGRVVFEGLDNGTYVVKAEDPSGKYVAKFSSGLELTEGDNSRFTGLSLPTTSVQLGRLKGTITQVTDNDLDGRVLVYPSSATNASVESGDVQPVAQTSVSDYAYDGVETLSRDWSLNVPVGSYKVRIVDGDSQTCSYDPETYDYFCNWSRQVWIGGANADSATTFSMASRQTRTMPTTALPAEATARPDRITGTVTGAGGAKLDDVQVQLVREFPNGSWSVVASVETGADGTFGFDSEQTCHTHGGYYEDDPVTYHCTDDSRALQPGTFTLRFVDQTGGYYGEGAEYPSIYFGNVPAPSNDYAATPPAGASEITLAASGNQTANAAMTRGSRSTASGANGKLADDRSTGRKGNVVLYDERGYFAASTSTWRDGTWSLPVTTLPPGNYKISASGQDLVGSWVGGHSFRAATTYSVPIKGAKAVGTTKLQRYATINGLVTASVPGTDDAHRIVTVWDATGHPVDTVGTEDNGRYSVRVVPGSYRVSADGTAFDSFDESDAQASRTPLIERFWKAAWNFGKATPINAGSGATINSVNLALSNLLAPVTAPKVSGTAAVGKRLTASTGSWNESGLRYTYVWKRGTTVVGRASSYVVKKADVGKTLKVTVTATDPGKDFRNGSATASKSIPKPRKR